MAATPHYVTVDTHDLADLQEGDVVTFTAGIAGPHPVTATAESWLGRLRLAGWIVLDREGSSLIDDLSIQSVERPVEVPDLPGAVLVPTEGYEHLPTWVRGGDPIWRSDSGDPIWRSDSGSHVPERAVVDSLGAGTRRVAYPGSTSHV